ncbi:MAG: enoyl-CoA hydratase-related protein [Polaromonas sp.]|nr:enoyl-CoA hydratase-related protein [Polaromonas sp.]
MNTPTTASSLSALSCFSLTVENHIAHLVLSRPEAMNTMHPTFWRELDEVLTHINKTGEARVLVISSTGKHFSAGMALETFGGAITMDDQSPEGRAAMFDLLGGMQATFTKLETLRMPVIAAIQGGCIGGAVDMVTACCIRYATADAFFCIQEINIGMVADVGTLQRLPKLVPLAVVKELAYTGRRMPAQKALGYGLVNEVFDSPEAMLAAALQCAKEIASKPPVAIWGTKQAIHYTRDHSVDDALKQMGWLQGAIWSNQHVRESVTAMKEKRAGTFPALSPLNYFNENGL